MEDIESPGLPDASHAAAPGEAGRPLDAGPIADAGPMITRGSALLEVLAVSGLPTQLVVTLVLVAIFRMPIAIEGQTTLSFFTALSLLDTALVVWLIGAFLTRSQERVRDVFIGQRRISTEAWRGLALVPVVIVLVGGAVLTLRAVFPSTHTVPNNPLEAFMGTPAEAGMFLIVVVIAGGVREEMQRAFILHRFRQRLGGANWGLLIFSVAFGLLHLSQGVDASLAIGVLGLAWGVAYLRRGSAVLPMANHAGFNALQVIQVVAARSLGW